MDSPFDSPTISPTHRALGLSLCALAIALALSACSSQPKSPDVSSDVRKSLDQAGLKDVSVSQDRENGVVTLGGHVANDSAKQQAQSIAQSLANGQVVANEIAVAPSGPNDASAIDSDLDKGIAKNLDAALRQNHLHGYVDYNVKNGVVTLTGNVNSDARRAHAAQVAHTVPNVQQVVNELQVRDQKATSNE